MRTPQLLGQWVASPAVGWWLPLVAWWFRSIASTLAFLYLHLNASVLVAWGMLVVYLLYLTYVSVDTPEVHAAAEHYAKTIVDRCPAMKEPWRYPIWAAEPNLTTLYSGLVRPPSTIKFSRDWLDTPDGGVTVVDFSESPHFTDTSPIVLIIPGTGGTSHASYVNVAAEMFRDAKNWRAAVTAWRGCGTVPLKSPRLSHAGDTEDLSRCVEHIRKKYPRAPLMALAFSLGAQVLTKYLGESAESCPVIGAVSISQGYDNRRALRILLDSSWFYSRMVTKKWTDLIRTNSHLFTDKHSVIVDNLHKIQTWEDYDREVTIRMNGFPDVDTFYQHINARAWMDKIRCPLLCLNAKDDPLISHSCIDYKLPSENPLIMLVVTSVGGHLAWPEGFLWPKATTWADRVSLQFLSCIMSDWEEKLHPWLQPKEQSSLSSASQRVSESKRPMSPRGRRGSISRR